MDDGLRSDKGNGAATASGVWRRGSRRGAEGACHWHKVPGRSGLGKNQGLGGGFRSRRDASAASGGAGVTTAAPATNSVSREEERGWRGLGLKCN